MDGAYEKVLAKVLDPRMPLRLLPPYQSVTEDAFRTFLANVTETLPGWLPPTMS